jgi:hypothetical protein
MRLFFDRSGQRCVEALQRPHSNQVDALVRQPGHKRSHNEEGQPNLGKAMAAKPVSQPAAGSLNMVVDDPSQHRRRDFRHVLNRGQRDVGHKIVEHQLNFSDDEEELPRLRGLGTDVVILVMMSRPSRSRGRQKLA